MANAMTRALRHLFAGSARRLYPVDSLHRIAAAIAEGETAHRGQVCFAVESSLPLGAVLSGLDAGRRARDVFSRLRVWDTEANNGVLVYLLLADHHIEIVADRGVDAHVPAAEWAQIAAAMQEAFRGRDFEGGLLRAVDAVDALLVRHFARAPGSPDRNELPDAPLLR